MGAGVHWPVGAAVPPSGADRFVVVSRPVRVGGATCRPADRVLLIAVYYRTNLTLGQVALLFGVEIGRAPGRRPLQHPTGRRDRTFDARKPQRLHRLP